MQSFIFLHIKPRARREIREALIMTFTIEQVSFMQERIQAWCRNSPHTITKGDVFSLLTDARLEVEETPKYDPCRPLKKGDKVKLREEIQGRKTSRFVTGLSLGKIYTVETDEFNLTVDIVGDAGLGRYSFVHLELVTPVEELEPYRVDHNQYGWHVEKDGEILATYNDERHPHAKEAAEAECARLNDEYRKGQK